MKKKITLLLVSIFSFFGIFYLVSNKVRVEAVACESQFGICSQGVSDLVLKYRGESYFAAKKALSEELSENSRVEQYQIRFGLPDELLVEVVEKKPEVALQFGENKFFIFDKEGNVVGEVAETQLPRAVVVGVPTDNGVVFAVKLFRELFKYYNVETGTLDEFGLTASIRGTNVHFPLSGDVDVLLGSAEVALLQLPKLADNSTISANTVNSYAVDLRYKNPVISKK